MWHSSEHQLYVTHQSPEKRIHADKVKTGAFNLRTKWASETLDVRLFGFFLVVQNHRQCRLPSDALDTMVIDIPRPRLCLWPPLPHHLCTSCRTWKTASYDCNGVRHVVRRVSAKSQQGPRSPDLTLWPSGKTWCTVNPTTTTHRYTRKKKNLDLWPNFMQFCFTIVSWFLVENAFTYFFFFFFFLPE